MARLRRADPGEAVEVWAGDEARLGLKPIARRVWSPRGRRPRAGGRTRYDWLYVYGFARPSTGRAFAVILPRVNAERAGDALAAFAARADPDGVKVPVVLVDNAGWPVAKRLAVPPNVVLHFLPPCTPELQPAEPLWPLGYASGCIEAAGDRPRRTPWQRERRGPSSLSRSSATAPSGTFGRAKTASTVWSR